jgi:hypothetical protein
MIFKHTSREKGMWRGWFNDGQSVEINWDRWGWRFAALAMINNDDDDRGRRLINISFWRLSVWLPLGITAHPWPPMEGPQWGVSASKEFGLTFHWGHRRRSFDWPWDWHTLAYEEQAEDGSWHKVSWRDETYEAHKETYGYTYALRNGTVQERTATVSKRRHVLTYRAFKAVGWPCWIKESIDVQFSDEVGERSGSWKGGCIGCAYDLLPGETMEAALRRMERDRKF